LVSTTKKNSGTMIIIWLSLILLFAVCIAFPLINILFEANAEDYKAVFSNSLWHQSLKNTLIECILSSTLSVITGYIFAYAVVKGNIPFKKIFSFIPVLHLITPPFVSGLSFILLFGKQGLITNSLLHMNTSLYGLKGIVIAQVLCFFPIAYLINLQVLRGINTNLENAAKSLGAGKLKVFLTVTLPLSRSGIIASFLFIAVNVLSDFGNPMIVGERFSVLAVEVYNQIAGWTKPGISTVYGLILIIPSIILFTLQFVYIKKIQSKTSTIGSRSMNMYTNERSYVSKPASVILFGIVLLISMIILAQFVSIIAGSFQRIWSVNTKFTTDHIIYVLTTVRYSKSLFNSIFFALISAVISITIACFCSYITNRSNLPLKKTLDIFSQLPTAIPGTLLGLALSLAASKVNFRYSPVLIIISMTISFLPFAYRMTSQTFGQIKMNLDDNAKALGSSDISILTKILMPVSATGIFHGFTYNFIRGAGTLSSVIFLISFNTQLTSNDIINLAETGDWGKAAALSLILTILTFTILIIGFTINKILFRRRTK